MKSEIIITNTANDGSMKGRIRHKKVSMKSLCSKLGIDYVGGTNEN